MESETMPKARRVMVALSEDVLGAADEVVAKRACSRSALVEDALRWYLRVQDLAWDEASPEEIEAIERGRAEHARGEFATLDEIRRDLAADLLERAQRSRRGDGFPP
jgi:metal-responsive CopG/Arc/MetJ family transcriptional regulator